MKHKHQLIFSLLLFFSISSLSTTSTIEDLSAQQPKSTKSIHECIDDKEIHAILESNKQNHVDCSKKTLLTEMGFVFEDDLYIPFELRQFYTKDEKIYKTVLLLSKVESDVLNISEAIKESMKKEGWRERSSFRKTFPGEYINQSSSRIQEKLNLLLDPIKGDLSHGLNQEAIERIMGYRIPIINEPIFAQKNKERVYEDDTQIEELEIIFEYTTGENKKKYITIIFLGEEFDAGSIADDITDILTEQDSWEFKSFSHTVFLGKHREENALRIEEKLNNIHETQNSAVLVIID